MPADEGREGAGNNGAVVPKAQTHLENDLVDGAMCEVNGVSQSMKSKTASSPLPREAGSAVVASDHVSSALDDSEDEIVGFARNGARKLRPSKPHQNKRRIIDDQDESDDRLNASRLGKSKSSSSSSILETAASNDDTADGRVNSATHLSPARPIRTTRSSQSASAKPHPSVHDGGEQEDIKEGGVPTKARSSSLAAPRDATRSRQAQGDAIPKKKVRRTTAAADAETTEAASQKSSLLAQLDQPPVAAAAAVRPLVVPTTRKPAAPIAASAGPATMAIKHSATSEPKAQAKPKAATSTPDETKERKLQHFLATQAKLAAAAPPPGPTQASAATDGSHNRSEAVVMHGLQEICKRCSQGSSFRLPPTSPTSRVDLSGSFLDDDRYDFFDTNERGENLLALRPPIFPEEFPKGMKEHSLSWWGILDPAIGDGKYRPPTTTPDPRLAVLRGPGPSATEPSALETSRSRSQGGLDGEGRRGISTRDEGSRSGQNVVNAERGGSTRDTPTDDGPRGRNDTLANRGSVAWGRGSGHDDDPRGGDGRRQYDRNYNGPPPDAWNGPGHPRSHANGPQRSQGRR